MKVESAAIATNSAHSSTNSSNTPTKLADPRHIDEAISAVIASSTNHQSNSSSVVKNHQQITSMSLGNPRVSHYADLPENLLETSTTPPMQTASSGGMNYALYTSSHQGDTPVLTSLTPVNVDLAGLLPMETSRSSYALSNIAGTSGMSSSDSAGLTQLFPMVPNMSVSPLVSGVGGHGGGGGTLPGYLAVKVEPQEVVIGGTVVSSGTVSALLSPSQLNLGVSSGNSMNLTSMSSAGELLSLQPAAVYVQPSNQNGQVQFFKLDLGSVCSSTAGNNSTNLQSFQKLNLSSNNVSTVDLANNLIATMLQQQKNGGDDGQVIDDDGIMITNETVVVTSGDPNDVSSSIAGGYPTSQSQLSLSLNPIKSTGSGKKRTRSLSSGGGAVDVDDEVDDIYIDTKDLCSRIAYELKAHSIPQAVFAERVLCRSQGTLSDLLRNPKPWNKLKSGRETFRRMYQWLKQPLSQRLASLEMWKGEGQRQLTDLQDVDDSELISSSPDLSPVPVVVDSSNDVVVDRKIIMAPLASSNDIQTSPRQEPQPRLVKKPRLVFTDIQKRTLQAIFKETQRPSREMQQTIAEHLGLDLSTVQNFFMNARRRSRIDQPQSDSPAPYQQVRPITPPPASPGARGSSPLDHLDPSNSSVVVGGQSSTSMMFAVKTPTKSTPSKSSRSSSSSQQQQKSKQSTPSSSSRNKQKTTPNNGKTTPYVNSGNNFASSSSTPYEIGTKIQLKIEPAVDYPSNNSNVKTVLIDATITGAGKEMKMVS